jgi:hypothetical protein
MRHQAAVNVRDVVEDLYGMLERDDLQVALIRCTDLLGDVCEYALRCVGETNPKRKWGIKLLAKYADSAFARDVRDRFWQLQLPDGVLIRSDTEAARRHVRACIELAEGVLQSTYEAIAVGVPSGR